MPQRRKLLQRRRRQKDRDSRLLRRMRERRPRRKGRHSRLSRRKGRLHSKLTSCLACRRADRMAIQAVKVEDFHSRQQNMQVMMNRRQAGNGRA